MTLTGENAMMDAKKGVFALRNIDWRSMLRYESGSVLMIVFGILLAMNPDIASAMVSTVLGWIIIAAGVAMLISGFTNSRDMGSILIGALLLVAGSWLHRHPMMIASVLGVVLGIVVLKQGWQASKDAQRIKRGGGMWIPGAVLAAAELLIGVRLIFSPLSISRLVLTVAGIAMVVCGVCNLVAYHKSTQYIPGAGHIIDADE